MSRLILRPGNVSYLPSFKNGKYLDPLFRTTRLRNVTCNKMTHSLNLSYSGIILVFIPSRNCIKENHYHKRTF